MKRRIGISYTKTKFEYYWNWFTAADLGDDLELVELNFEKDNTEDIGRCDGFILTGGIDVDPGFYEGEPGYQNRPDRFSPERDRFEEKIYRYSQWFRLPVLAICRGMQLVNVIEGGKLIQDLDHGNRRHRKEETDKEHAIITSPGTLIFEISGLEKGHVNSAHHQAIDPSAIGKNLLVNVFDDDEEKIIEGMEFADKTGKGFLLCVQWHPERMKDRETNVFSLNLKKQFLAEIRRMNMKKIGIINPATEELIGEVNQDTPESLGKKLDLLKEGQPHFAGIPQGKRIEMMRRFAELLEEKKEELAAVLSSEVGKPLQQSRNEINGARARIAWLSNHGEQYLSEELMTDEKELQEKIVYEPLGVICNISAWNYPFLVGLNVFVPALMAGNAVMYKPSEHATLTGLQIEKLLKEAGIPDNVFQMAIGAKDTGEALLELPFDGYFFTGSYATGKRIYEKLAPKMVPCQCEMGGKDPLYVAEDVHDIRAVASATADGAFYNNGQSCCAVERIYVHENIYDQFLDEFVREVSSWKIGPPGEAGVYIGPLARKEQLELLEAQVEDARIKGGRILAGGKSIAGKGFFFEPTVVADAHHDMKIMRDESFGPVIGIMKVKNDEEAVEKMKDTDYGLTASVYSRDRERAEKILARIDTGTGYWNCCDRVSAAVPWSGRKHSGFGATLSHAGIRAFTKPKAYHLRG